MADSPAFVWICDQLERQTDLDRLEARGTVRIALKRGGFEPGRVRAAQMRVVIERILPGELEARGVDEAGSLCRRLSDAIPMDDPAQAGDSAEEVFGRLGGGGGD